MTDISVGLGADYTALVGGTGRLLQVDKVLDRQSPNGIVTLSSVKSEIRETIATSDFLVPLFFPIELGSGAPDAAEDRDECLYPRIGRSVPNEQSLWSYYGRESNHSCSEERIECAFS